MGWGKRLVRSGLASVEALAISVAPKRHVPPVFIVGLPRVGSTLASIIATRHLRCAMLSNMLMATPGSPVATAMLLRWTHPFDGVDDLRNVHGETSRWHGPNQGHRFWKRFITSGTGTPAVLPGQREPLLATVAALQGLAGGPLINKWQTNALRIPLLAELFPGALFVHMNRDVQATAESILHARRTQRLGEHAWFSVRVPGADPSSLDIFDQIAFQIGAVGSIIDESLRELPARQVLRTSYEEVCTDPNALLERMCSQYAAATGGVLAMRSRFNGKLVPRKTRKVSEEDSRRLADALARHHSSIAPPKSAIL